jgi:hypothetical protein
MTSITDEQTNNLPSFLEIKEFITDYPKATIREITNYFKQEENSGNSCSVNYNGKKLIWALNIKPEFAFHLQKFIKHDYVIFNLCIISCIVSDSRNVICNKDEEFIPIVLSIR